MNSIQSETFVECFKNLGMAFDKLSNTQLLPKGTIYNDDFNSLKNKNLSSKKTDSNLSEKNFELNENEKNSIENNNDENYLENISITKKTLRKNIEETLNKEENNLKRENQKKKKSEEKEKKRKKIKFQKKKI